MPQGGVGEAGGKTRGFVIKIGPRKCSSSPATRPGRTEKRGFHLHSLFLCAVHVITFTLTLPSDAG